MAPNSKIANNYVSFVDQTIKSPHTWLKCKKNDDNAEGLWRIHDDLYDLTSFVDAHPGGKSWLTLTEGTDITELFLAHHVHLSKTKPILSKYFVRKAEKPRNSKFTFHEDGFYMTLKRKVEQHQAKIGDKKKSLTNLYHDLLVVSTFILAILSTYAPWLTIAASLTLSWTVSIAHNYFHQADNFRMYSFNLGFLSVEDWRVSHAISHHMFPNSKLDLEMASSDILFKWLPQRKNFMSRFGSWVYSPLVYSLFPIIAYTKRNVNRYLEGVPKFGWPDMVPFVLPLSMYLFGGAPSMWIVFKLWMTIILVGAFIFVFVGVNIGHHHPEVFHDGDSVRANLDWGIHQLDTMIDRSDIKGNHFMAATSFGDHVIHHMFPTLDHVYLHDLYPILDETMREFGVEHRTMTWPKLILGQFQQLAREEPSERLSNLDDSKKVK